MVSINDLRTCELFPALSDEELGQIAAIAREEEYQVGEVLCSESEIADRLFILKSGKAEVRIRLRSALEASGEATIEEVEPGRIFGWSSLVKQRRFTASARALEPVQAIVVQGSELNALFDRNVHMGFVVMKQLAEVVASRLRHTRETCEQRVNED
jgi:CRP/FNR family cyclic AMP-dependent transcriptional regulator